MSKRHWTFAWTCTAFTLVTAYLCYPYLAKLTEFIHNDIVYNYWPFRQWFNAEILHGEFPLWDPFMGLGRRAELWTSLPLDFLTPLQLLFPQISFATLLTLQTFTLLWSFYYFLRYLGYRAEWAILGAFFFFLNPVVGYWLPYYIHFPGILLFVVGFCGVFLFLKSGRASHLLLMVLWSLIFCLGGKLELIFYDTILLSLAISIWTVRSGGATSLRGLIALAALATPLLCHAWYFSIIGTAWQQSIRLHQDGIDWYAFLASLKSLAYDQRFQGVVVVLISSALSSRLGQLKWLGMILGIVLISVCSFHDLWNNGRLIGLLIGTAAGLYLLPKGPSRVLGQLLPLAVLMYYWGRPSPGDVEEIKLMHSLPSWTREVFTCITLLGLYRIKGLASRWFTSVAIAMFFCRTLGLVILSHFGGMLWLPARDNFLMEWPLTLFFLTGLITLFSLTRRFLFRTPKGLMGRNAYGWVRGAATVLITLLLLFNPRFHWHKEGRPLLSERIESDVKLWETAFAPTSPAPTRLLSYFHTAGRSRGLNDVREYQSLLSSRFAQYSISQRLGISRELITRVGGITAELSPQFVALIRPRHSFVDFKLNFQKSDLNFYFFFLVHAVPPLNCDHLRWLGVRGIEGGLGNYNHPNAFFMNLLFSKQQSDIPKVDDEVLNLIHACDYKEMILNERNFYEVASAWPRAFFLPHARLADFTFDQLTGLRTNASELRLPSGKSFAKESAEIISYRANSVEVQVDTKVPGFLMLTDLFDPGWVVSINGQNVSSTSAFDLVRGVELNPGKSSVLWQMTFPRPLLTGIAMALGWLAVLLLILVRKRQI